MKILMIVKDPDNLTSEEEFARAGLHFFGYDQVDLIAADEVSLS